MRLTVSRLGHTFDQGYHFSSDKTILAFGCDAFFCLGAHRFTNISIVCQSHLSVRYQVNANSVEAMTTSLSSFK